MDLAIINARLVVGGRAVEGGVGIRDGRIVFVGKNPPGADVTVDAGGRILTPGLRDAHMHLAGTGLEDSVLDLRGARSVGEILSMVSSAEGEWVLGRGWDQERLREGRPPFPGELDDVSGGRPVLLIRTCGHVAVANTRAMELLGIDSEDGVLLEEEVEYAWTRVLETLDVKRLVAKALRKAVEAGLVELHVMSVGRREFEAVKTLNPSVPRLLLYLDNPRPSRDRGAGWRVAGAKVFADGSFGGWTAAVRQPYLDRNGTGVLRIGWMELAEHARWLGDRGLELAVHAIGDLALEHAIRAAEAAGNIRVEHASLATPDLIGRMGRLRLTVAVQPHFIVSDWWLPRRLGRRVRWAYPFSSMIKQGVRLLGSSDSPVEPLNPWTGVWAAVTRGCPSGSLCAPTRVEALSLGDALGLYEASSLTRGSPADIVVWDSRRLGGHPAAWIVLARGAVAYSKESL